MGIAISIRNILRLGSDVQKRRLTGQRSCALIFSCLALAACQNNSGSTPVASRAAGPRITANSANTAAASTLVGQVYSNATYQSQFQDAATGFLSTDVNPLYVGTISDTGQNNSGVYFSGKVSLAGMNLSGYTGSATISGTSTFTIQVRDYVSQYPSTSWIPPFTFYTAQGTLNGSQAQIVFSDSYGSVTLSGTVSQTTFQGTISYDNGILYDGTRPGAAGTLGNFTIPICSFFVCN